MKNDVDLGLLLTLTALDNDHFVIHRNNVAIDNTSLHPRFDRLIDHVLASLW